MRVQKHDGLTRELLTELMEAIEEDRRPYHPSVTDLLRCLTQSYLNYASNKKLEHTDKTKVMFVIGLGLEQTLLFDRKHEAISGQTDGIWWHVDSVDKGLLEFKSTRGSRKRYEEEGFPEHWILQIKGYCKAVGVTEADLAVVYLISADFQVYHLTFEPAEIETNWDWMLQRKDIWDNAVETGKIPESFRYNQDWECKDCQYKILCEQRSRLGI